MRQVFIVRHGDTFEPREAPRRIGHRTDLPLTARGVDQGYALGTYLAAFPAKPRTILASPLLRATGTAEAIAACLRPAPPVVSASWLSEIDHGPDEGRLEADVVERIGLPALQAWDRAAMPPPDWRVDADVRTKAWREFLAAAPPGPSVLVTSAGMARFVFGACPDLIRPASLKMRTGSFSLLVEEKGRWRLVQWGCRP